MSLRPWVAAAGVAAVALTASLTQVTYASGIPANKVAASGSSTKFVNAVADTLLLSETVKINNPTDLIIGVSAECAILTQVTNSANGQTERAFGEVKIYVTINGKRVPVADNDADQGRVVFCNRAQEQQWTDTSSGPNAGDDSGDRLRQYLDTRTANAVAQAAVGNRTLILEPVKAANDERVTELG